MCSISFTYIFLFVQSVQAWFMVCLFVWNDLGGNTHYIDTAPILGNDICQVLSLNSEIITHWGDVRLNLFKLPAFIWYGFTHHLPLLSHVSHYSMYKSIVVTMQLKHGHSTDSLVLKKITRDLTKVGTTKEH